MYFELSNDAYFPEKQLITGCRYTRRIEASNYISRYNAVSVWCGFRSTENLTFLTYNISRSLSVGSEMNRHDGQIDNAKVGSSIN